MTVQDPLLIGRVYRVKYNYGLGTRAHRLVGRLTEVSDGFVTFRTSKRVCHTMDISSLVELRFVERGDK